MRIKWVKEPGQRAWAWVAIVFAAFYFGEAYLFWGPEPRLHAPNFAPLVYWGTFGTCVIWLLSRSRRNPGNRSPGPPRLAQTVTLGVGITASVVCIAFLVIRVSGNVTLGHAVMLGTLFEAAVIIGGMSGNVGWTAASLVWAASAALVLVFPSVQDYTIGAATVIAFALVGLLPWSLNAKDEPETSQEAVNR